MENYIFLGLGTVLGGLIGFFASKGASSGLKEREALLKVELERIRAELGQKEIEIRKEAERAAGLEAKQSEFKEREVQMRAEFENMARKIFDDNSRRFSEQSKEGLSHLINPMKEKFTEFQKLVDDKFGNQAKEQFALKEEIKRIVEVSGAMRIQTESLTKALKGDVKAQGNWGEVILERILEESGLREGTDYILQGSGLGLKDLEGRSQKPDVLIKLPEGKHIVLDAKVSLTHYERFCAEGDDAAKAIALRQFLESTRAHVQGLSSKRYEQQEALATPDFVLMFMPIEGAYSLAMQQDQGLHQFAWEKKIVIVCPTTLFATLRTIASLWKIELQNRNVQEIARQGGNLYDKFVLFVEEMKNIGDQLERTGKAYKGAMNKLVEGTGNLIARAESLRKLGAKTSKQLPKELVTEETKELENV